MSFVTPVDGNPAIAEHVAQLTETLSGTRAIPVSLQTLSVATKPVVLSPDAGNTLQWKANGLFVPTPTPGLTQATADTLYEPLDSAYTKAEADARYLTPATAATTYLPLAGGTLTGNLLFSTDNARDIGASGATRPRDLFLGRNLIAGSGSAHFGGPVGIGQGPIAGTGLAMWGSYTGTPLRIEGSVTGATAVSVTIQPGSTGTYSSFYSAAWANNAAIATMSGYRAMTPSYSGSTSITNAAGFYAHSQGNALVTNAFGVYIEAQASATVKNVGLYNAGTTELIGNMTLSGDLVMNGVNKKITGDFTSPNQIRFVTNQANSSTSFQVQPSGTGTLSSFYCWDKSDTANAAFGGFTADNGTIRFSFGKLGTASNPNMWVTSQAQGAIMYWWDSGKVQILKDVLQADVGLTVTGNVILNSYWMYGTGMDLGNAGNTPNKVYGYKAWGGAASLSCTGSSGFVIGGGIVASPMAMANGEAYLFIARDGYWWAIASQGVI